MRQALVIAAFTALAVARPETYKEKEDFQYSRSSSDDGTKSGFYGAQRGNMGGNYERAHNMDLLAQHQMGGLVRTVEGELGDGAKQRSGSVFSAANSRGIYGSGRYDLSNLEGRNFQEGASLGESQSHSSLSSHNAGYGSQTYSSAANSAYDSRSHNSKGYHGYQTTGNSDQALFANNMQSADNLQSISQFDRNQEGHSTGYQSQSGYQGQSGYDQAAANSHLSTYGTNYRLVGNSPVRVIVRPGGRVAIPVAAQTYDTSQGSTSTFDQNAINSEAEVLGSGQSVYKPTNNAKHYESSYSYRKEWEKHNINPVTSGPIDVPTVNPYPSNSELYEDTQVQGSEHQRGASLHEAQNVQSSSQYRGYNVKSATSSSQSRQQAAYDAHAHSATSNAAAAASNVAGSNGYIHGAYNYGGVSANLNAANLNNQVEDVGSKPKSYQSSYSYHKSWERQGDPYVIKPSSNGLYTTADTQASQRLTASSLNQGASSHNSHQYGAHYHQGHQGYSSSNGVDCDENGHVRVARSSYLNQDQVQEYVNQQTQNEDLGQQSQNLEDFSQQSQDLEGFNQQAQNLEDFGQQSQNSDDLGQQSQNLGEIGQQSQNLEDFGQLSQNLGEIGQQSQNLEDFGQQSQNLGQIGQQSQNLEDFGQQSQNLGEIGQQSQNLEDFGQQSQHLGDFSQQSQNLEDFGQQSQNLGDFSQQTQNLQKIRQQSQSLQDFGQQAQDAGQLTQTKWENLEHGQQAQTHFDRIENLDQQTQNQWDQENQTDLGQQTQNTWSMFEKTQNDNGSKATTEHQQNSTEHTKYNHYGEIYDVNNQDQKKTALDKDGVQIYYTQSERTGIHTDQQPHSYWSMNQNNQNTYVPILPLDLDRVHPNTQQYSVAQNVQYNTGYSYNQPNGFPGNTGSTAYNPNPWMYEQTYSNNPNNNFQPNEYVHSYASTQTHVNRNDHSIHSTSDIHHIPSESGSTGLMNLWNLIDDIEKQTITINGTGSFNTSQENNGNINSFSSSDKMNNFSKNQFDIEDMPREYAVAFIPTVTLTKMETTTIKQDKLHSQDVERGDVGPEKLQSEEEEGRGDIGPENSSNDNSNNFYKPLEIHEIKPKNSTLYKTPEEKEALSLTNENKKLALVDAHNSERHNQRNNKNDSERLTNDLTVLGLSEKPIENFEQGNWNLQKDIQITTNTTPQSSNHYVHSDFNIEQGAKSLEQHNTDQNIENLGQRVENINQQNNNHFEGFQHESDHQLVDFGQQNEHLKPKHLEKQPNNIDQQNVNLDHQDSSIEHGPDEIQQQNVYDQQNVNLDHQDSSIEHGPDEIQQQNVYDQFQNLGQESENLNQHSLDQFEDYGQQSVKLGQHQELDNFGQQNDGFHQENLNDFGHHGQFQQESLLQFDHSNENLNQPQKEQELENWVQQTENFEQQNQPEHEWEPKENLQQQQASTFVLPSVNKEGRESNDTEPVVEPIIVTQKSIDNVQPIEPEPEKVGFWNKLGSKFATAKVKVKSWFSSS